MVTYKVHDCLDDVTKAVVAYLKILDVVDNKKAGDSMWQIEVPSVCSVTIDITCIGNGEKFKIRIVPYKSSVGAGSYDEKSFSKLGLKNQLLYILGNSTLDTGPRWEEAMRTLEGQDLSPYYSIDLI